MSFSIYQASIPAFIRALNNLSAILTKGTEFATAKKIEETVLTQARLAPDMFPLARQVQIASDAVKGGGARLANIEVPSFADTETTFAELQTRIAKTIDFLKTIKAEQLEGAEDRTINLKAGPNELTFSGADYLTGFVLPNLYFHSATTYAILRHNGVELGKMDFLGAK